MVPSGWPTRGGEGRGDGGEVRAAAGAAKVGAALETVRHSPALTTVPSGWATEGLKMLLMVRAAVVKAPSSWAVAMATMIMQMKVFMALLLGWLVVVVPWLV